MDMMEVSIEIYKTEVNSHFTHHGKVVLNTILKITCVFTKPMINYSKINLSITVIIISIYITPVNKKLVYIAGPTSKTLGRRCINARKMICVAGIYMYLYVYISYMYHSHNHNTINF